MQKRSLRFAVFARWPCVCHAVAVETDWASVRTARAIRAKKFASVRTAWAIHAKKIAIRLNGLSYPFKIVILMGMDNKQVTLRVLLDLSATFDTIEISIFLNILQQDFGVVVTALNWFDSFLSGRKQLILVGDKTLTTSI